MTKNHGPLTKELATRINKVINIPLISEEHEQVLFELIISILLQIIFDTFDSD